MSVACVLHVHLFLRCRSDTTWISHLKLTSWSCYRRTFQKHGCRNWWLERAKYVRIATLQCAQKSHLPTLPPPATAKHHEWSNSRRWAWARVDGYGSERLWGKEGFKTRVENATRNVNKGVNFNSWGVDDRVSKAFLSGPEMLQFGQNYWI